ncbi:MAG: recombinase RecA [Clostridia bacterium]|nr:recombinase RecA [Clostridia bacterium]
MNEERSKALDAAIQKIEKAYGTGSIMKLGDVDTVAQCDVISTGCLVLDEALGVGGLPRGRIVELFGPESSGKTTLALHVIAEAQKAGGIAAYIDAEHAMDPEYASALGVNIDDVYISQPDTGEQALDIVEALVRSNAVDLIVVDSVAALTPKAEVEGDMGDTKVGLLARLMSQALRKLTSVCMHSKAIILFINQIREMIATGYTAGKGPNETTPGGRALKFAASVRLDIRRMGSVKSGDEVIGNKTKVKVVKNKVAPPFKTAEFEIIYGKGISNEGCVMDLGVTYGVLQKSGNWFVYKDEKIANGREKMRAYLDANPDVSGEIYDATVKAMRAAAQAKKEGKKVTLVKVKGDEEESGNAAADGEDD